MSQLALLRWYDNNSAEKKKEGTGDNLDERYCVGIKIISYNISNRTKLFERQDLRERLQKNVIDSMQLL